MNFNFLSNKKRTQEKVFEFLDNKYNCDVIISIIDKDLNLRELSISNSPLDAEQNRIVFNAKSGRGDDEKHYIITINEPVFDRSNAVEGSVFYTKVIVDRGDNCYIDYEFESCKYGFVDENPHGKILRHYSSVRYVNGDVSVILGEIFGKHPFIKYEVVKGNKKALITKTNPNWRLDAVFQKLENLDIHEIYKEIKEVSSSLVLNLGISITDNVLGTSEELSINDGKITKYNKHYTENGVLTSLSYEEGKLIKKTELVEDNLNELKSSDVDVKDMVVKIKTLN